jgi:hypothetical protein
MAATDYHYHSFPRRWRNKAECVAKGLSILESFIESGLLLTPEHVAWPPEFRQGVRVAEGLVSYHRRACFTHLLPEELSEHAKEFGPFCIEFDNWRLRMLGGIPVFYLPVEAEYKGYLGVGLALASRLADFQTLLERLKAFQEVCAPIADKSTSVIGAPDGSGGIMVGPQIRGAKMVHFDKKLMDFIKANNQAFEPPNLSGPTPFGANVGSVESLLRMLTWGIQSFDIQLGAIQAFGGFFYPTERLGAGDLLSYYRQREWRIVGSMMLEGVAGTRTLSDDEKARLLKLDSEFFGRPIKLRDGREPRVVDECVFLSEVDKKRVLEYASRIVCPASAKSAVEGLLRKAGFGAIPVVELDSLMSFGQRATR